MKCEHCGKELGDSGKYCWNCGKERPVAPASELNATKPPSESLGCLALLLFIFLGVPSCLGGGCLLMFAPTGGGLSENGNSGFNWSLFCCGIGLIAIFGALLYFLKYTRPKK